MACEADAFEVPELGTPPPRRRRRRSSVLGGTHTDKPILKEASTTKGSTEQLSFEAKYYGSCPEIPGDDESPKLNNVLYVMASRKVEGVVLRSDVTFSQHGVVVTDIKTNTRAFAWHRDLIVSCATLRHPTTKFRQLGLLKVWNRRFEKYEWHLFKYYRRSAMDNMSACFRFLSDCNLHQIGKSLAEAQAGRSGGDEADPYTSGWDEVIPPPLDIEQLTAADSASVFTFDNADDLPPRRSLSDSLDSPTLGELKISSCGPTDSGYIDINAE